MNEGKGMLSYCSILTIIIVLTSIYEGRYTAFGQNARAKDEGEVGLLVTADLIKLPNNYKPHDSVEVAFVEDVKKTRESWGCMDIILIDGKKETGFHHSTGWGGWVELSPGLHEIIIMVTTTHTIKAWGPNGECIEERTFTENCKLTPLTIAVEPKQVYVVMSYVRLLKGLQSYGIDPSHVFTGWISHAPHHYDKTKGEVTHPTDSNLSFKVKQDMKGEGTMSR